MAPHKNVMHGSNEGNLGGAHAPDQVKDFEARHLAERAKREALQTTRK